MLSIFLTCIFSVYLPIHIAKPDDLSSGPEFYQVNYTSSDFQTLKGFYRKEDDTHNGKNVYKKPSINNYLYLNDDDKWTVGTKWTKDTNEDKITMDDGGYDLPESGDWKGKISGRGDDHVLDVSITEYKPEYPDYYQVESSYKDIEGYYKKLQESQNYHKFPIFRKKIQGKETFSLFLHLEGDWIINRENETGKGFANSKGKGLPRPDLSKGWKTYEGSWKPDDKFRVTPLHPFYPTVYSMEYQGSDKTLLVKLQTLNVLGSFTKQPANHQAVPQFENQKTRMNLFLCSNGQWVIAYRVSTTCNVSSTIYQESNGSPTPLEKLTWKITEDDNLILDLSLTAEKLPRTSRKLDDDVDDGVENGLTDETDGTNIGLVLGIVLGVVTFLVAMAIIAFFIRKKFSKEVEEPRIDDNMYYGDDYYDDDNDNAVVDNNDYYET